MRPYDKDDTYKQVTIYSWCIVQFFHSIIVCKTLPILKAVVIELTMSHKMQASHTIHACWHGALIALDLLVLANVARPFVIFAEDEIGIASSMTLHLSPTAR